MTNEFLDISSICSDMCRIEIRDNILFICDIGMGGGHGVCVCVCVSTPVSKDTTLVFLIFPTSVSVQKQGDMACVQGPCPMKLPDARDMRADHSHVPAIFQFFEMSKSEQRRLIRCFLQ